MLRPHVPTGGKSSDGDGDDDDNDNDVDMTYSYQFLQEATGYSDSPILLAWEAD